jgi:HEAT repeat protein
MLPEGALCDRNPRPNTPFSMKKLLIASAVLTGGVWMAGDLGAHGGTYRGPGDTVPPGAGGGSGGGAAPTTGGPAGPTSGGPTTPGTGGPVGPATGPAGTPASTPSTPPTGAGGDATDLSLWSFWWEFNKDAFINLRAALDSGSVSTGSSDYFLGDGQKDQAKSSVRPSRSQIEEEIVPALKKALANETNNDIITGCLIALAKIGDTVREDGTSEFQEIIGEFLADPTQEIRETAAVSLGILGNPSSLDLLEGLVMNTDLGHKAVKSTEVDDRTRAFATYGLGLVGALTDDMEVRQRIVQTLADAMPVAEGLATQDVAAAVVIAMGLVPLESQGAEAVEGEEEGAPITTIQQQVAFLLNYFEEDRKDRFIRAHIPTSVGRLYRAFEDGGADLEEVDALKAQIAGPLLLPLDPRKGRDKEVELRMASALALGLIGDADSTGLDGEIRDALMGCAKDAERQVRKFALIALAKSAARDGADAESETEGRDDTTEYLIKQMKQGKSGIERWAGLAAGVYANYMDSNGQTAPSALANGLREQLKKAKAVDDIAAFSVATGIYRDQTSAEELMERLDKTSQWDTRGYVALGLGLLGHTQAIESIQQIVEESEYRPDLLKQAAIALGLLGDRQASKTLVGMLEDASKSGARGHLALRPRPRLRRRGAGHRRREGDAALEREDRPRRELPRGGSDPERHRRHGHPQHPLICDRGGAWRRPRDRHPR